MKQQNVNKAISKVFVAVVVGSGGGDTHEANRYPFLF